jgi:aryl-alcohol dehydrogenase-like predicted oxidoreductase
METEPKKVNLGQTHISIPPLGVGTWAWGDSLFWGYGNNTYSDTDLQEAFQVSLQEGVTFFDTAEIYGSGRSEELLGQFQNSLQGTEKGVVLASKFMPLPWRFSRDSLLSALRASLKRLRLSQLDLYQIHWPLPPMSIEVWGNALADAVEAGLTRAVGVSNYSEYQMRRIHAVLANRGIPLAVNQVQYSLLHRDPEKNGVLQACQELGITLLAYSPLGMGLLTGKYSENHLPPGPRRLGSQKRLQDLRPLLTQLRDIAVARQKTPAQIALSWIIHKGAVPIPGAKNAQQARDNAGALTVALTESEIKALEETSILS